MRKSSAGVAVDLDKFGNARMTRSIQKGEKVWCSMAAFQKILADADANEKAIDADYEIESIRRELQEGN